MQAMKGATMALGSMNRTMNLPSLQRIAMEFERENDIMEQRQEIMDEVTDDALDVGLEEEGDEVVEQVLEEIGVDLSQAVGSTYTPRACSVSHHGSLTIYGSSLARRLRAYNQIPLQNPRSPRQWAAVEAAATRAMTTSKLDSIV